ncbi:hypothetical protein PHSY_002869 [Pseudozyma hubeiensis SY62]|uniref:Uncharacterized protein n=1 Tax=Pseudozyma hubeiensis (strain SY62) TaxID=1305764 RepID=R9P234_PSEHS|nr:hypothetical protein PHSY_002869 [Pseudozyma hubeiensis SY62]GAC95294.1 hypothetical protein PHSY_002869 [Pseudozyma hubeiensis SY62]
MEQNEGDGEEEAAKGIIETDIDRIGASFKQRGKDDGRSGERTKRRPSKAVRTAPKGDGPRGTPSEDLVTHGGGV